MSFESSMSPLEKERVKKTKETEKMEHDSYQIDHCYLNLPEDMIENNPLNMENIKEKQDQDADFQHSQQLDTHSGTVTKK